MSRVSTNFLNEARQIATALIKDGDYPDEARILRFSHNHVEDRIRQAIKEGLERPNEIAIARGKMALARAAKAMVYAWQEAKLEDAWPIVKPYE